MPPMINRSILNAPLCSLYNNNLLRNIQVQYSIFLDLFFYSLLQKKGVFTVVRRKSGFLKLTKKIRSDNLKWKL